ncbi:tRNA threonylcarbamoyl adenosine modification protein TsaE [Pycnococcus provasolii]
MSATTHLRLVLRVASRAQHRRRPCRASLPSPASSPPFPTWEGLGQHRRHASAAQRDHASSSPFTVATSCFCEVTWAPGKTTLARAFVRRRLGDESAPVPSPTYLLQQVYDAATPIHHYDLYRLPTSGGDGEDGIGAARTSMLDLATSFRDAITLIEWPDRLDCATAFPAERFEVTIDGGDDEPEQDANDDASDDGEEHDVRKLTLTAVGDGHAKRLREAVASMAESESAHEGALVVL